MAIRDFAQAVDDLGFTHLLVYDHVLGADPNRPGGWSSPYDEDTAIHEPFVLFGYLAGLTRRIDPVTTVLVLTQRQTALVAKQAAEADILSGAQLRLGVGTGWNRVEYEALGVDFGRRGAESLEKLRVYLTEEGRDPVGFGIPAQAKGGTPERWQAHVSGWRDAGCTHTALGTMRADFERPDQDIDAARRICRGDRR